MNGIQSFSMHSSFPKREYTNDDMQSTLRDLQLAPTATLLIIPVIIQNSFFLKSKLELIQFKNFLKIRSIVSKKLGNLLPNSSSNTSTNATSSLVSYTQDIFSFIFLPVTILWNIIGSLLGLGNNESRNTNQASSSSSSSQGRKYLLFEFYNKKLNVGNCFILPFNF